MPESTGGQADKASSHGQLAGDPASQMRRETIQNKEPVGRCAGKTTVNPSENNGDTQRLPLDRPGWNYFILSVSLLALIRTGLQYHNRVVRL